MANACRGLRGCRKCITGCSVRPLCRSAIVNDMHASHSCNATVLTVIFFLWCADAGGECMACRSRHSSLQGRRHVPAGQPAHALRAMSPGQCSISITCHSSMVWSIGMPDSAWQASSFDVSYALICWECNRSQHLHRTSGHCELPTETDLSAGCANVPPWWSTSNASRAMVFIRHCECVLTSVSTRRLHLTPRLHIHKDEPV